MYLDPVNTVYQGDILDHFLFSSITQPTSDELDFNADIPDDFSVTPRLSHGQALIITQTCDVSRRDFISVVPIFSIESYISALRKARKKEENITGELAQLKKQKIFYYYYIPEDIQRGVNEGYADLTFINPFERSRLESLRRIARLDDYQRHTLAYKLGNLYMRPH